MKKNKYLFLFSFFILIFALLISITKGQRSLNYYQITKSKEVGSPFESSGSTSRYALTETMVENHTFFFTKEQARFSAPDMVEYQDKFFSIFTPGVSILGIPFYLVGKIVNLPQLFTYLSTITFSLVNLCLVAKIARKFGARLYTSLLSGFIFLFATNALSYSLTYSQHHLAVTIILLAFLNLFGERTLLKNIWLGMLFGIGLLVDLPNALIMLPIIAYAGFKHSSIRTTANKIKLSLKLSIVGLVIGLIPFLTFFSWYNYQLTGSYIKIGQTIGRSDYFDPPEVREKHRQERENLDPYAPKIPFNTRDQLYNFYILLVSNERGWLFYSPIVLMGVLGLLLENKTKKNQNLIKVVIIIVLINIIAYSLFHGAEGGWAFGPRYLIPAAALLSAALGIALEKYKKNLLFIFLFFLLFTYSLRVNIIGAMTTTQVPPKVEAVNLANPIPYTYKYNLQLLQEDKLSSLVYNLSLSDKITVQQYAFIYFAVVLTTGIVLYTIPMLEKRKIK